jgi:hypothetical protein
MEFRYEPPAYSRDTGLTLEWEGNYSLSVRIVGNEVIVAASQAGLLVLAKHLQALAQGRVPAGAHLH